MRKTRVLIPRPLSVADCGARMTPTPILTRSISSLLFVGALTMFAPAPSAKAAISIWDGGGVSGTDLGTAVNWSTDVLPSVVTPDTAQWDGTVAGSLSLVYSNTVFAGAAGNTGLNLDVTATQTSSLNIDSGTNTGSFRLNNISIAAGAGAFSLGNSSDTFNITLGGVAGQTHTWINNSSNTATIASDVVFGLGGGGVHTVALGGAGNWTFNNAVGQGTSGTLALAKNDAGTLTLAGLNTYTGGLVLNAGTLNINNAGAIGNTAVGALTINGGTIDNTSGAAITTTTAKAQNWNGDFTFSGTNNLNFNGGVATLGGNGTNRTVTVGAGTLTDGSVVGVGYGLTKAGAGTLTLGSAISRITGVLNVAAGTLNIGANDFVAGGLTGSGTIQNSTPIRWLFIQNNADYTFSGVLANGATNMGFNKSGTGTQTLTGINTYADQTTAAGGTIEYGSSSIAGITQSVGRLVFDKGDSAVKSSFNGTGTASLTFITSEARTAGATGNFIVSGGTNGVDNKINLTKAAGFIDQGTFFNGSSYAYMDGTNTFVRGLNYGVDAGAVTSGAAVSLASATHQEFTGDITAQDTATFTTLKDTGNNALTLNTGATVTTNGILKSGNVAGGATISGGAGIQAASGAELVIRTDRANDALTISTPILANGTNALTTSGAGTLTLSGANTYTGQTSINSTVNLSGSIPTGLVNILGGGTLNLTGTINATNANNGQFNVGSASGGNAILNINGGTLKAGKTANPSFVVGGVGNANTADGARNANGFVNMTSGTLTTASELHIGNGSGNAGANPYAAFTMSGGSVTSGSWIVLAANNDRAVLNQSGGSITVSTNRMTIGAGGANSVGVANLSGGTFTDAAGIYVGENGTGTLNVSGTAAVTVGNVQFNNNATSLAGTVNLLGGTLSTATITKGAGTGTYLLNFNGGTLKATAAGTLMASLANTSAYVQSGGGTIDNGGFAITIAQPLLAPTGNGVSGVGSFTGGSGYIDTPVVTILRGAGDTTGVGATAVANVSGGVVTGITITNPGTGYTATPTFVLFGGGYSTPATVTGAAPTANSSGGLVFSGSGNTTLTGQNVGSYTGGTTVNSGTLTLTGANNGTGIIRGTLTINAGATVNATTANAFGYNSGVSVTTANINGGTLNTSATGDQAFNTTYNLTGGTLTSNGGVSDANATSYWVLGRINAGTPDNDAVNTLASATTSTIAGRLHLRSDNANNNVTFTTANGAAATDLLVSAAITEGGSVGIIKAGPGTMELSGGNTYTGATTVNNGTLLLSGSGASNNSSGIIINGSGAKFVQTSSVPVSPTVTLTNGTLDGTGTVNTVNVGAGTGGIVANGNGGTGSLTIGALTFAGAGSATANVSSITTPGIIVDTLTTTAGGLVTVNASNTVWTNGQVYDLIGYTTLNGAFSDFTKGVIANLGARQSATLTNPAGFIALSIAGDLPVWTGAQNGNWTTAIIGGSSNWKLQSGGTATDFITGDTVLFNDGATGTTTVNIAQNVSPTSTTFSNTTKNYTLTSSGGFGIASGLLVKNGSGSVTINNANTYAGGTTLNAGTLNLNNASAIGTGPLTIAGGAINNTSGSPITLTTNNAQNWNGDFAFTGTNDLNLGTGAITLNATPQVTVVAGTLTVDGAIGGTGFGVTKAGGGTLVLDGANTFNGDFTINAGTVRAGNDAALSSSAVVFGPGSTGKLQVNGKNLTVPGLSGDSGAKVENSNATNGTLIVNTAGTGTYAGVLQDGSAGTLSVTKSGTGSLTLSGTNSYTGGTTLSGGTLNLANASAIGTGPLSITGGTIDNTSGSALTLATNNAQTWSGSFAFGGSNDLNLGTGGITLGSSSTITANGSGVLTVPGNISGGTFNLTKLGSGSVTLAGNNTTSGSFLVNGGTVNLTGNNTTSGSFVVNGGTVNIVAGTTSETNAVNTPVQIANASGTSGTITVGGTGTLDSGTSEIYVGQGFANASAVLNLESGGTINVGNWFVVGRANAFGTVNMSGGTLNKTGAATNHITIGSVGTGNGTFNQSGGVINSTGSDLYVGEAGTATGVYNISGTAVANIPGLQLGVAAGSNGTVNLDGGSINANQVTKGAGAATFNFNGGTLRANAGANATFFTGLTTANVRDGGAVFDTNGQSITVGQSLQHSTIVGDAAIDGGLTKKGNGTLTLSGTNNYKGATTIEAGTLALTGSISGSTAINVKSGATFDVNGVAGGFTLVSGQKLDGTGTVTGAVSMASGSTLAPGFSAGTLTLNGNFDVTLAVTPTGSGALQFELGPTNASDLVAFTSGALTIGSGVLAFDDFSFSTLSNFGLGTYVLFDGTSPINGSLDSVAANLSGNIGGLFGTLAIADGGNDLVLNVSAVPEPGTAAAAFGGLACLIGLRRRRRD